MMGVCVSSMYAAVYRLHSSPRKWQVSCNWHMYEVTRAIEGGLGGKCAVSLWLKYGLLAWVPKIVMPKNMRLEQGKTTGRWRERRGEVCHRAKGYGLMGEKGTMMGASVKSQGVDFYFILFYFYFILWVEKKSVQYSANQFSRVVPCWHCRLRIWTKHDTTPMLCWVRVSCFLGEPVWPIYRIRCILPAWVRSLAVGMACLESGRYLVKK